jgi:hypothetical protein
MSKNKNINIEEPIKLIKLDNAPDDQKCEFYNHKLSKRNEVNNCDEIKKQRDKICAQKLFLYEHQALLANFVNLQTPYEGLLVCHATGTGPRLRHF